MERSLSIMEPVLAGYDESFLSVVPDNLKCNACHYVLRQPIQIMKCGHRICQPCLERLKKFSEQYNTVPTCPVDKEIIDLHKIFDDTVIEKAIDNLLVSCSSRTCTWTGYLRDLEAHADKCSYMRSESFNHQSDASLFEVYERLLKCEALIVEKEKEVKTLISKIEEIEKTSEAKQKEEQTYRLNIEKQVTEMEEVQTDLKERLEKEVEFVKLKNEVLENKVKSLEEELVETKQSLEKKESDLKSDLKSGIEDVTKMNFKAQENIIIDVSKLKEQVERNSCVLWTSMEGRRNDDEPYNLQCEVERTRKEVQNMSDSMRNIESFIFPSEPGAKNETILKWHLSDYEYHRSLGKKVFSPVFYTHLQRYRFQFHVSWSGDEKDVFGIFLHLHRGLTHQEGVIETFRMQYTFEMVNQQGEKHCVTIPLSAVDANRADCFEIAKNQNKSYFGCGCKAFLKMPNLLDYISHDQITIFCRFKDVLE